jgi:hypothetical protein
MTHSFHPSTRQPFLDALTALAEELKCRGKIAGDPPLPKAKNKFDLNNMLWNQVMMDDKEGVVMSLELGADVDYTVKGRSVWQLAKAYEMHYGPEIANTLESYGAKPTPPKKRINKKSAG